MNLLRELFDVAAHPDDTPDAPPPVPAGKIRVHLFAGDFPSEDRLMAYCFDHAKDEAEQLNKDLPGAYLDSTYVATGFGSAIPEALADFFPPDKAEQELVRIGGANSLVVISEHAFGGFPYVLDDTPSLAYLGPRLVDLP